MQIRMTKYYFFFQFWNIRII